MDNLRNILFIQRTRKGSIKTFEYGIRGRWCNMKEVRDIPINCMADVLFAERIKNRFSEWRDGLLQDRHGGSQLQWNSNDSKQQFQTVFFKMRPTLNLTGFTSHQFRLIQLVMCCIHNFIF